jgi:hypothetical protein
MAEEARVLSRIAKLAATAICLGLSLSSALAGEGGYKSLVFDEGPRSLCYQHLSQTREGAKSKQAHVVSTLKATACPVLPERRKACTERHAMWQGRAFLPDGGCPTWFLQTFNWTEAEHGRTPGWSFASLPAERPDAPLVMRYSNLAAGSRAPCDHHEVGFSYNFPGISFPGNERVSASLGAYKDVTLDFTARIARATASKCEKLKRNLIKLSFIVRWHAPREGGGRKTVWQSSIAVLVYDHENAFDRPASGASAQPAGSEDVTFWNRCTVHALYQQQSCMLTLSAEKAGLPTLGADWKTVHLSLTRLMKEYESYLVTSRMPKGLTLENSEIKTVQIISAVNGADMVFDLKDVRLRGLPRQE